MELEITMMLRKMPMEYAKEVMREVPEIDLDTLEEGLMERFGVPRKGTGAGGSLGWMEEVLMRVQQYQKEESLLALRANRKAA
tara:strand:- start:4684 stop:4932 length:249 start_codon:yes stop_codon:yes gene_type:complete